MIKIIGCILIFISGFMLGYWGFEYKLKPAYNNNLDTIIIPIHVESYYTIDSTVIATRSHLPK